MQRTEDCWTATVDLPPGAFPYRFHVGNAVVLGDARRTTERVIDGETWSVLHVTADAGPVWIDRSLPTVAAMQVCQGLSEDKMPLLMLERARLTDFPVIVWAHIQHLYQDALLKVFLVRPDGDLAFGAEFVLESGSASADYDLKFWLSLTVEPEHAMAGAWTFMVEVEGGPVLRREVLLQLD